MRGVCSVILTSGRPSWRTQSASVVLGTWLLRRDSKKKPKRKRPVMAQLISAVRVACAMPTARGKQVHVEVSRGGGDATNLGAAGLEVEPSLHLQGSFGFGAACQIQTPELLPRMWAK